MVEKWRAMVLDINGAYTNLVVDEAICRLCSQGKSPNTIRDFKNIFFKDLRHQISKSNLNKEEEELTTHLEKEGYCSQELKSDVLIYLEKHRSIRDINY